MITTPRTGSTFLCDLMFQTGIMGKPSEFFNLIYCYKRKIDEMKLNLNLPFKDRYQSLRNHHFMKYGTLGSKLQMNDPHQKTNLEQSNHNIQYWVWMVRENVVMQAISWYKAEYTKQWTASKSSLNKIKKENLEVPYHKDDIVEYIEKIKKTNAEIENFLQDKKFIKICYEKDICKNPINTIKKIQNFLDLNAIKIKSLKINYNLILRDNKSFEWEKLIKKELEKNE